MRRDSGIDVGRGRRAAIVLAIGCAAVVLGACSLLTSTSADQCQTTSDCAKLGGEFANRTCVEKVCVAPAGQGVGGAGNNVGGAGGAGGLGGSAGDGGTGGVGSSGPPCMTNSDCMPNESSICRTDHTCVSLLSNECTIVVGDPSTEGTIVLGYMGPLIGEYMSLGIPIEQGAELAIREIATNVVGLPEGPSGSPRHIVMVACHDLDNPIVVAKHLVDDVQVPAIVGPAFSGIAITVATNVTVQRGVLIMSPSATSPTLTDLSDKEGLVWRTVPSDAIQAIPLAALVPLIEADVRTSLHLEPTDKIRVAMAQKGDAYGMGLANAVTDLLSFNGTPALMNGSNFTPVGYPDTDSNPNFDFTDVVSEIVDAKPHIVLALGTNEAVDGVMKGVEAAWPTDSEAPPRPRWVFPDGGRQSDLTNFIGNSMQNPGGEDLRTRIIGTVPGRDNQQNEMFSYRYMTQYKGVSPGTYSNNAYDAVYLLAYAMAAAGTSPITGSTISDGLSKTVPPATTLTEVGPTALPKTFTLLENGGAIDFDGASGPLDFDLTTGEAPADITVWCVGRTQTGDATFVSSMQYYDAKLGQMEGQFGCQ